jgi:cytochrome b
MSNKTSGLIWDFPTRAFHWALAAAIVTSLVSVNLNKMELHFTSGSVVLFLLLFRVFWGLIGPETAQFHRFLPLPARWREWRAGGIGHSPWASLSVFAFLGVIGAQATLGLFTDDEIYLTGPLRDEVSSATAYWATKTHAQLPRLIVALIVLHLAAIAFYTFVKRSDLLKVFVTGRREGATRSIQPRPWYLAVGSAGLAALPVLYIFS